MPARKPKPKSIVNLAGKPGLEIGDELDMLDAMLASLRAKAIAAARANKPTMWAYYRRMERRLADWFAEPSDRARAVMSPSERRVAVGGIAGAALALVQYSQRACRELPDDEAAALWAMGTYANRLVRSWSGFSEPRDLGWLRDRVALMVKQSEPSKAEQDLYRFRSWPKPDDASNKETASGRRPKR